MTRRNTVALLFALIVLVAIPAAVHIITSSHYAARTTGVARMYWEKMPASATVPYVFLAFLFGLHCSIVGKASSRWPAYCGAVLAWLFLMRSSVGLLCLSDAQITRIGPTGATLGLYLGPIFAIAYAIALYAIGVCIGSFTDWLTRWLTKRKTVERV